MLAIQGGFAAHVAALRDLGVEAVLVRKPEELAGLDGLILPGGESTTVLRFLSRGDFFEQLKHFAERTPVFGTCAGAILLASEVTNPAQVSLGLLDATVERNGYGRQNESSIEQTKTTLPGGPLEAVYIRAPRITRAGPQAKVLATREGMPVLIEQEHILAATFHPELSRDRRVHERFLAMVRRAKERMPAYTKE